MIDLLNHLNVDYAVFGNHEFDFGSEILLERIKESNFKWVGSNVKDTKTGQVLGGGIDTLIFSIGNDIKIGMFGVCTQETPQLSFPGPGVVFEDIIETSKVNTNFFKRIISIPYSWPCIS